MISHFYCPINWNAWLGKGDEEDKEDGGNEGEKGKGKAFNLYLLPFDCGLWTND
ncbi:hypothetical protein [Nostoc sp. NIES-3756]|jgi:hypothetical protein|uniref:hypothetical protein n=1 Tax=Nostoc sp. NIES-3756 TaxID=1751286 RepID=UPI000A4EE6BC|nr:hypothetical protein [Nostoc sp. NIES-3756]